MSLNLQKVFFTLIKITNAALSLDFFFFFFELLFLIPQFRASIYTCFVSLLFLYSLLPTKMFWAFFTLFCIPSPVAVSLNAQELGLETGCKMGEDFILQGKQVKQKTTCTAVFVSSESWGAQELSESQPGSSQQQFYCLCWWSCKGSSSPALLQGSSSPALLHPSVGLLCLTHRRHAGGGAFFL